LRDSERRFSAWARRGFARAIDQRAMVIEQGVRLCASGAIRSAHRPEAA
jgi:hypothetical protein